MPRRWLDLAFETLIDCAEHLIPYTETDLVTAYRIVIRYLNRVGLGYADPFDCPLAMPHRAADDTAGETEQPR